MGIAAPKLLRGGALLLWLAGGARAEEAGPAAATESAEAEPAASETSGVEEIIVTISKRSEPLQEIPAAVSAFDAAVIQDANIQSFADIATLVPNTTIKGGANDAISIRGISQSFTSQSPVALHVNGVFKLNNTSIQSGLYDLETIELARGPAGTVYGRNATAGALNIRWAEPVATWEAKADVSGGNYDAYDLRGVLNVPFSGEDDERLMGRFVLQRSESNSSLHDLETKRGDGSVSVYVARGTLRSVLGDSTVIEAHGFYNKRSGFPAYGKPLLDSFRLGQLSSTPFGVVRADPYQGMTLFLDDVTAAVLTPQTFEASLIRLISEYRCGLPCPPPALDAAVRSFVSTTLFNLDPNQFGVAAAPIPESEKLVRSRVLERGEPKGEVYTGDLQLQHELGALPWIGAVRIDASIGWESEDTTLLADADGSELPILDDRTRSQWETLTGELRLSSAGEGPIGWILGFFAFDADLEQAQSTLSPFGEIRTRQLRNERGLGPFMQLELRPLELLSDDPPIQLELFGGARYNIDDYERDQTNFATPATCSFPFCVRDFRTLTARETFRETTWEAGARWLPHEQHSVYLKFSHGYKAGLVELVAETGAVNPVSPELIDAFELGWKSTWLDGELQTALTWFLYDYTDLQVPQLIQGQVLTSNAAAATIWGIEAEARWQPRPFTSLSLSVSQLEASFDSFCADDAFQLTPADDPSCTRDPLVPLDGINGLLDLSGNTLEDSPEWKVAALVRHTIPLGAAGYLTPVAEFTWSDSYYRRPFNVDPDRVNDYHRSDLRLIWTDPERRWSIEAFVQNLEDEHIYGRVIVGPEFTGGMPVGITPYAPRSYGLRVGAKWGG